MRRSPASDAGQEWHGGVDRPPAVGISRPGDPRPTRDEQLAALGALERFADRRVTFTDCLSFGVMKPRRIERVFGFDGDFRIAGFILVPVGSD